MQQNNPGNGPQVVPPLHHLILEALNTVAEKLYNAAIQANTNYSEALKVWKNEKEDTLGDNAVVVTDNGWMLMPKPTAVTDENPSPNGTVTADNKGKKVVRS